MAEIFSATLVRVNVTQETLEQIVDLLKIPKAHRDRILRGGLFIAAPAAVAAGPGGGGARAASRARRARPSAASSTASRTPSRTTRPRK